MSTTLDRSNSSATAYAVTSLGEARSSWDRPVDLAKLPSLDLCASNPTLRREVLLAGDRAVFRFWEVVWADSMLPSSFSPSIVWAFWLSKFGLEEKKSRRLGSWNIGEA